MPFELVVLGANGTFPGPDRAATGFLLRSGGKEVWMDCGTGTFSNLQKHIDYFDLSAVMLSHLHLDHVLDIYALYYALKYSIRSGGPTGIDVYAPAGAEKHLGQLLSTQGENDFTGYLIFNPIDESSEVEVGSLSFKFARTLHPIEAYAMRITAEGRTLVYTADSGATDSLVDFAKGADVLLAEASMHEHKSGSEEVHMTAREAGRLAAQAGAGRLILTHVAPGLDPQVSLTQASNEFEGEVLLATECGVIQI
ncbi:MAG: MBL fold metallo-hydrolase [Actinobacteria bacterium]|nr:MBL fold metallo-hydrolase [Actinomycetota bacterium]